MQQLKVLILCSWYEGALEPEDNVIWSLNKNKHIFPEIKVLSFISPF